MHLSDGEIRSYQDKTMDGPETKRAETHLVACQDCQDRAGILAGRTERVQARLATLDPGPDEAGLSAHLGRARFEAYINRKEEQTLFQKLFAKPYRPAWAAAALVLILAVALLFPPVRAAANTFLGLFRVQQFTVVQVNPGQLPEQLGSSSTFENLLSEDVKVEELGEMQEVAGAPEASAMAGFPVRLPEKAAGPLRLKVQPGTRATFQIDLARVQAVLDEVGRSDIQLPAELDGETVTVEVPVGVVASYGICDQASPEARELGADPDDPTSLRPYCTTLAQMVNPTISAPEGLDVAALGESFLRLMGMTPEEAALFSKQVDWTSTLVIPIPRYGTTYEDVTVDGVPGTLITQSLEKHAPEYLLIWLKEGILYALTGSGNQNEALELANSLR
jgi:hypothetical protein